jgi:hypothetical protein
MTAQKHGQPVGGASTGSESGGGKRKPWIKKTPVEGFLQQVTKQEKAVEELRQELAKQERDLKKMQDAAKLLQAK